MASDASRLTMEDRAQPRDEVLHRAWATLPGQRRTKVILVNISTGGFMARLDDAVETGDRLSLALPLEGSVTATIRWALGGRIGCQFERELPPARYAALLEALGGSA